MLKVETCPGVNCRCRKAAELMVKHRAANLADSDALTKFGKDPHMETVVVDFMLYFYILHDYDIIFLKSCLHVISINSQN